MSCFLSGQQRTIGLDCSQRHVVKWFLGKDNECFIHLEETVVDLCRALDELRLAPICVQQSCIIHLPHRNCGITADLKAKHVITGVKAGPIVRIEMFEQTIPNMRYYLKQSDIFFDQLLHYYNKYEKELKWIKKNPKHKSLSLFLSVCILKYCRIFFVFMSNTVSQLVFRKYQTPVGFLFRFLYPNIGKFRVPPPVLHSVMSLLEGFFNYAPMVLSDMSQVCEELRDLLKDIIYDTAEWNKKKKNGKVAIIAQEFFGKSQRFCTNLYLWMNEKYYPWRHTGYLFGTLIYLLDTGCRSQYESPAEKNLCLLTGMCLGLLVTEQEVYFDKTKFVDEGFDPQYCQVTAANFVDAILHIWVYRITSNVNIFYMNELRDEYVIYKLGQLYHRKHQTGNLSSVDRMAVIDMVKRLTSLSQARADWCEEKHKCKLLNLKICPCIITLRFGLNVILQWMDITFSFQNKGKDVFNEYNFYNTGKIISHLKLSNPHYPVNLIPICCCGLCAKLYVPEVNEKKITFSKYYLMLCKRLKKMCNLNQNELNQKFIERKIAKFIFFKPKKKKEEK